MDEAQRAEGISESADEAASQAAWLVDRVDRIRKEVGKAIVGHEEVVIDVLACLLCGGHALLEGVPGLGKTYLIKTLGTILSLHTSRIQFTPDLMPADILGTNVLHGEPGGGQLIRFQEGPIFAQLVLADEINRATPKTQSALLEAMQEETVTIAGKGYRVPTPFMVLATQNPIELEGTYPLPEAQLDRFFFKISVGYPTMQETLEIIDRTTVRAMPEVSRVVGAEEIARMRQIVRSVPISHDVKEYAARIVFATRPPDGAAAGPGRHGSQANGAGDRRRFVRYGSSPRGAQALVLGGKVFALLDGRYSVGFADIRRAALAALRHRLILTFEGEAEGVTPEMVIDSLLDETPES